MKQQIKIQLTTTATATAAAALVNDQDTRTNNKYTKEKSKPNRIKRKILVNEKKGEKKQNFVFCTRPFNTHALVIEMHIDIWS